MCGIAGIVLFGGAPSPADEQRVASMVAAIRHRGPDQGNLASSRRAVLGHARLSILDLTEAARQPMRGRDLLLTYNGELFEFGALRSRLAARGRTTASTGDTEVLLRLLELDWTGALAGLRGMFAFAVHDDRTGETLFARDALGKKPLFFARSASRLTFASELSALAAAGVELALDPARVPELLVRGYVPAPGTICRGVEQLGPGEAMLVRADGSVRRWQHAQLPWLAGMRPGRIESGAAAEDAVREAFLAAVRRRMVADVPVGAFLSGGFDSAAVVAAARSEGAADLQTFSIGFHGAADADETAQAARSAELIGTTHRTRMLDADALTTLSELTSRSGEPQGDSSAVPTYAVARFAAEHVKVVLTGDGGDELFAGYDRFLVATLAATVPRAAGAWLSSRLQAVSEGPGGSFAARRARRLARAVRLGPAATLMEWAGGARLEQAERLLGCALDPEVLAEPERVAFEGARRRGAPVLHALLTANLATYLPGDVLVKLDRASMAVGLEARSPFLDEQLLEVAAGLAPFVLARGRSLKWIVKRALRPLVPTEIASRPKRGFGAPVARWFRGRSEELKDVLCASGAGIRGVVDPVAVEHLVNEHDAGRDDAGILLWRLYALEEWLRWARRVAPGATSAHTQQIT